ncbi:MAG: hypothetical protein ACRCWJ_04840, partial [Casimicrobium sp.]
MKYHLYALLFLVLALAACIPVTVRPQFDDTGLPIALPVTPVGHISPTGELTPIYPVSDKAPSNFNWAAIGTVVGAITTALAAAYGINLRGFASKAQSALKIACELADKQADATDPEVIRMNKLAAQEKQI